MKKIFVLLFISVLIISCDNDDDGTNDNNEPICVGFSNETDLDLSNPLGESTIVSDEIIIDNGVIISDINVKIETKCEDLVCGLEFEELGLYFRDENGNEISIRLVGNFAKGNDTFTETTFDNESENSLDLDNNPYLGSFKPIGDLSQLYGVSSKGTWQLFFEDAGINGVFFNTTLDKYTIEICNN